MTALPYEPGDRVLIAEPVTLNGDPTGDTVKVWATVEAVLRGRYPALAEGGTLRVRIDGDEGPTDHPVESVTCAAEEIAGLITLEVMAQLEELSDDTVGALGGLAAGDDVLFNRLLAVAEDLRETLIATVDQRVADWTCDNSGAPR